MFTHPFADGDGFFGQGLGVRHVVLHYGLEQLIFVLPIERGLLAEWRQFYRRAADTARTYFHIQTLQVKWTPSPPHGWVSSVTIIRVL